MPLSPILSFPPVSLVFHRSHSTTELLHISYVVLRNFDNCRLTSTVALDFTKAFDTVNHDLLLLKLCGLSHFALSLICSFFTNRTQQILYTHVYNLFSLFSSIRAVLSGVPFSDLYSLIFFSNVSLSSELFMYADDVILLKSFHPFDVLATCSALNTDLKSIVKYSPLIMYLNPFKSFLLIVGSSTLLFRI